MIKIFDESLTFQSLPLKKSNSLLLRNVHPFLLWYKFGPFIYNHLPYEVCPWRTINKYTGTVALHFNLCVYSISVSGLVFAAFAVCHRCTQVLEKCILSIVIQCTQLGQINSEEAKKLPIPFNTILVLSIFSSERVVLP